jgi:hypothetical protein
MANYLDFFISGSTDYYTQYDHGGSLTGEFSAGFDKDPPPPDDTRSGAIRFTNVTVNQGVSVNNAELRIYASTRSGSGHLKLKVEGIKETNTADFGTAPSPGGRIHTTANNTNDFTQTGSGFYTINVTSIVNEILAQGGWVSGNHMGFWVFDNGSDTGTDNLIIDANTGTPNAVLSILVSANPSFTPTPGSVSAPKIPAKQNYGMRMSRKGFSADESTLKHINFDSGLQILKAKKDGQLGWPAASSLQSISHQLKYPAAFLTYFKYNNKVFISPRSVEYASDPVGGSIEVYSYATPEDLYMALNPNSSKPDAWYYYAFIDETI